jgi:hypothetical protein
VNTKIGTGLDYWKLRTGIGTSLIIFSSSSYNSLNFLWLSFTNIIKRKVPDLRLGYKAYCFFFLVRTYCKQKFKYSSTELSIYKILSAEQSWLHIKYNPSNQNQRWWARLILYSKVFNILYLYVIVVYRAAAGF